MTLAVVVATKNGFYMLNDTATLDEENKTFTLNTKKIFYSKRYKLGICVANNNVLVNISDRTNKAKSFCVSYVMDAYFSYIDNEKTEEIKLNSPNDVYESIISFILKDERFGGDYYYSFKDGVDLFLACIINNTTCIASYARNEHAKVILWPEGCKIVRNDIPYDAIVLEKTSEGIFAYWIDKFETNVMRSSFQKNYLNVHSKSVEEKNIDKNIDNHIKKLLAIRFSKQIIDDGTFVHDTAVIFKCKYNQRVFNYEQDSTKKLCVFSNYKYFIDINSIEMAGPLENSLQHQNNMFDSPDKREDILNSVICKSRRDILERYKDSIGSYGLIGDCFEYVRIREKGKEVTQHYLRINAHNKIGKIEKQDFPGYSIPKTEKEYYEKIEADTIKNYSCKNGEELNKQQLRM